MRWWRESRNEFQDICGLAYTWGKRGGGAERFRAGGGVLRRRPSGWGGMGPPTKGCWVLRTLNGRGPRDFHRRDPLGKEVHPRAGVRASRVRVPAGQERRAGAPIPKEERIFWKCV